MKQCASAECVPAHAMRAVKVLVCAKSIAEKLGMTHVSSAFQVEPSRAAVLYRLWSRTRRVAQSAPALSGHDPRKRSARPAFAIRGHRAQAEKVNGRGGLRGGIQIAIVFGRILIILLSQLQPLLICRW